jgi:hypothetical protein
MGLVGWCALSLAPVVALSPALAATFLLIAMALAACATLRVSLLAGALVAGAGALLFAVALSWLQAPVVLPAMLGTIALAGSVGFAELVSMGLEWDIVLRPAEMTGLNGADRAQTGGPTEPIQRIRIGRARSRREESSNR